MCCVPCVYRYGFDPYECEWLSIDEQWWWQVQLALRAASSVPPGMSSWDWVPGGKVVHP